MSTKPAAAHIIDLTANGTLDGKSFDDNYSSRELGTLIAEFPEMRSHVYGLLKDGVTSRPLALLAQAVSENPDADWLLLMIEAEIKQKRPMLQSRTIEGVVTEHVPIENWSGAYNIVPVPAIEVRQKVLGMTTDGRANDAAARCLRAIDNIRDEYGVPMSEPRHPDLASGKPWPIMTPDPYATAG